MNGQVSGKVTYNEWIKRQSAAVQDEALGPTKGRGFRKGDLDISEFVIDGREITVAELTAREPELFAA